MAFRVFQAFLAGAYFTQLGEIQNENLAWNIFYALSLVFPFAGWMADALIGRYNAIVSGTVLCLFAGIIGLVGYSLQSSAITQENFLAHIFIVINSIGVAAFLANYIPFATDQLVGASSDELGLLVIWYAWGSYVSSFLMAIVHFLIIHFSALHENDSPLPTPYKPLTNGVVFGLFAAIFGSLLLTLMLDYYCSRRCLETRSKLSNPIMLIIRVLNYARKNKCPRKRSAFTYIDEEHPSRLDFANTKFGGPFSEEQVEDVKTTLRLFPLIFCMSLFSIAQNAHVHLPYHMLHTEESWGFKLATRNTFIEGLVGLLGIPAYHFIIMPLFYKYIPSMLKRVGIGMCVCLAAVLLYASIDILGHVLDKNATCLLNRNSINETLLPIDYRLSLMPIIIMAIGMLTLYVAALKFILAQSPAGTKGLLFGLWYAAVGTGKLIGLNLPHIFLIVPNRSFPGCGLYYFLSIFLLLSIIFVMFLVVSRWYKLRMRERIVNIHLIVEEHYERYLDQEEEYLKEAGITPSYEAGLAPKTQ